MLTTLRRCHVMYYLGLPRVMNEVVLGETSNIFGWNGRDL